jgi:hypothetical protein
MVQWYYGIMVGSPPGRGQGWVDRKYQQPVLNSGMRGKTEVF